MSSRLLSKSGALAATTLLATTTYITSTHTSPATSSTQSITPTPTPTTTPESRILATQWSSKVSSLLIQPNQDGNSLVPIKCIDGSLVLPYKMPSRRAQLERLKTESFDVLVIGGGAVGCGTALDASTRGLKVAMVERDDYSAGTSGRSTKLIHGGIRYLENAFKNLDYTEYELVKEALAERRHMLSAAPYMNQPLPIMIPMFNDKWYSLFLVPYYLIGAKVYDLVGNFGGASGVPNSHFIDKAESLFQFPNLKPDDLLGAIVYYDGQMNDARMGLHLALTATQAGSAIGSRVEVLSLIHDPTSGKCVGANVVDKMTGEKFPINARIVVNATGPFADGIRKMDRPDVTPMIKGAAGVHIVLPDHYSPAKMGLIVPNTSDGRVLFFLPWEGATLAGTTDSESDLTMEPSASDVEVGFILKEANVYLRSDKSVASKDVLSAWSGIRPLVMDPNKKDTKSISRQHVIEVSPKGKVITIAGGKWTTYRRMAEDVVDIIINDHPDVCVGRAVLKDCITENKGIIGADRAGIVTNMRFDRVSITLRDDYGLPKDIAKHLQSNYGTRALQVAELVKTNGAIKDNELTHPIYGAKRLNSKYPFLEAEVVFAVRHEYALTAVDVLGRRMRLAFIDADAAGGATERVVQLMGKELGWSRRKCASEVEDTKKWLKTMHMTNRGM